MTAASTLTSHVLSSMLVLGMVLLAPGPSAAQGAPPVLLHCALSGSDPEAHRAFRDALREQAARELSERLKASVSLVGPDGIEGDARGRSDRPLVWVRFEAQVVNPHAVHAFASWGVVRDGSTVVDGRSERIIVNAHDAPLNASTANLLARTLALQVPPSDGRTQTK